MRPCLCLHRLWSPGWHERRRRPESRCRTSRCPRLSYAACCSSHVGVDRALRSRCCLGLRRDRFRNGLRLVRKVNVQARACRRRRRRPGAIGLGRYALRNDQHHACDDQTCDDQSCGDQPATRGRQITSAPDCHHRHRVRSQWPDAKIVKGAGEHNQFTHGMRVYLRLDQPERRPRSTSKAMRTTRCWRR